MIETDDIEINNPHGWTQEKHDWYEHLRTLAARIVQHGQDVTGNLGNDWYAIGCCCAIYGEQGRELFHTITRLHPAYSEIDTDAKFNKCLQKPFKSLRTLEQICTAKGISIKRERKNGVLDVTFFMDGFNDMAKSDALLYGVCDKQFNTYSITPKLDDKGQVDGATVKKIANFVMNIRYLIKHKTMPQRILEITYKTPMGDPVHMTLAIPTDEFANKNSFRKFIERHAGIIFQGTDREFDKIKERFFPHERQATMIEVLGWFGADNVFFYNNGAAKDGIFYQANRNGFIEIDDKTYYLPSANQDHWHDLHSFAAQRKFVYTNNEATLQQWGKDYYNVYGNSGMITMCFAFSCLFSDIIYNYCHGFVMVYLMGPPSGGKGSQIRSIMRLWGHEQNPLPIPGGKASDKSQVRALAQFVNGMVQLDEVPENLPAEKIQSIQLMWDRLGDKRATKDYTFNTEDVPITSGIMLTSNYRPKAEALLSRMVVVEVKRTVTDAGQTAWHNLQDMERNGISNISFEVLKHRSYFHRHFAEQFKTVQSEILPAISAMKIVQDRVVKNAAMLLTTQKVLSNAGVQFPFTYDDLKKYLLQCVQDQHKSHQDIDKSAYFFMCLMASIKNMKLKHGIEFDIDSDKLAIIWMPCYNEYVQSHSTLFKQFGCNRKELMDHLKQSDYYIDHKESYEFKNSVGAKISGKRNKITSVVLFDINKLKAAGFDIAMMVHNAQDSQRTMLGAELDEAATQDAVPDEAGTEATAEAATESSINEEQRKVFRKMQPEINPDEKAPF